MCTRSTRDCHVPCTSRNTKYASNHHLNPLLLLFVRCFIRVAEGQLAPTLQRVIFYFFFHRVQGTKTAGERNFWFDIGSACRALIVPEQKASYMQHLLAWAWALCCIAECCTKQLLGATFSSAVSDAKAGLGAALCGTSIQRIQDWQRTVTGTSRRSLLVDSL